MRKVKVEGKTEVNTDAYRADLRPKNNVVLKRDRDRY